MGHTHTHTPPTHPRTDLPTKSPTHPTQDDGALRGEDGIDHTPVFGGWRDFVDFGALDLLATALAGAGLPGDARCGGVWGSVRVRERVCG